MAQRSHAYPMEVTAQGHLEAPKATKSRVLQQGNWQERALGSTLKVPI
jgi:hypothetical protein